MVLGVSGEKRSNKFMELLLLALLIDLQEIFFTPINYSFVFKAEDDNVGVDSGGGAGSEPLIDL